MTKPFGVRLRAALDERGPLCVGIDPHAHLLSAWGLPDDPSGLDTFTMGVVDALAESVAVFKPQSAFFERFGSAGIAVLERAVVRLREAGALVLMDAKRGDVGSTMQGYAAAYLDPASPLASDAMTLSPYLGFGSLSGAIDLAARSGRGVYVLALTSNPEGPQFQHARAADGRTVGQTVIDEAGDYNARSGASESDPGPVGIVVGATIGRTGTDFSRLNGSILAPGLGAQGAGADDLVEVFGAAAPLVLPSMSREVMGAGPEPAALRAAATRAATQMKEVVGVG